MLSSGQFCAVKFPQKISFHNVVLSCDVFMWDDNIPRLIIPETLYSLLLFFTLLEATYKLNTVLFQYYTYQVTFMSSCLRER
jgi:hypothetical protein